MNVRRISESEKPLMFICLVVFVLSMLAIIFHERNADDRIDDCGAFRAKILTQCETEMQKAWSDEGADRYTREQNLKDNRICARMVDAVYQICQHPERKPDARTD